MDFFEIQYLDIDEDEIYYKIINKVMKECFKVERLMDSKLYVSIILTNEEHIREYNKKYRGIDRDTDVLSFPMFEKKEIDKKIKDKEFNSIDILGDMIISIPKVIEQAKEYGHSFERELSYMVVHSFYHLMGYDHIKEEDKNIMRPKEEVILKALDINR